MTRFSASSEKSIQNQTLKRKLAGAVAKRSGERFENILSSTAASQNIACIQIPSGMKVVRVKGKLIPLPVKTAFDFILAKDGRVTFLDTKSTIKGTFSYSEISPHQVEALKKMAKAGCLSGYVILFNSNTAATVAFFTADQLLAVAPKASLKPQDGILLGSPYDLDLSLITG